MIKKINFLILFKMMWSNDIELILKEWSDKSNCYKFLYLKSYEYYNHKNSIFIIPIIIISTLSGIANFTQNQIPIEYLNYFVLGIGFLNIFNGIFSTIHQYLKISELSENCKIAYMSWEKLYNNIHLEISKSSTNRTPMNEFINYCKQEYCRLLEISPPIPNHIIKLFHTTFKNTNDMILPDILGTLCSTKIYESKNPTSLELESIKIEIDNLKKEKDIEKIKNDFLLNKGRLPTDEEIEIKLNKL